MAAKALELRRAPETLLLNLHSLGFGRMAPRPLEANCDPNSRVCEVVARVAELFEIKDAAGRTCETCGGGFFRFNGSSDYTVGELLVDRGPLKAGEPHLEIFSRRDDPAHDIYATGSQGPAKLREGFVALECAVIGLHVGRVAALVPRIDAEKDYSTVARYPEVHSKLYDILNTALRTCDNNDYFIEDRLQIVKLILAQPRFHLFHRPSGRGRRTVLQEAAARGFTAIFGVLLSAGAPTVGICNYIHRNSRGATMQEMIVRHVSMDPSQQSERVYRPRRHGPPRPPSFHDHFEVPRVYATEHRTAASRSLAELDGEVFEISQ